jgi:hypothetical protein
MTQKTVSNGGRVVIMRSCRAKRDEGTARPAIAKTFPERHANLMVHTHSGFAKTKFFAPRATCEPYGAHSFWVGETQVFHSQNEMRILRCTLFLVWRNLVAAFPERDANPMVHSRARLAKHKFCIPRTACEPYGRHSF